MCMNPVDSDVYYGVVRIMQGAISGLAFQE